MVFPKPGVGSVRRPLGNALVSKRRFHGLTARDLNRGRNQRSLQLCQRRNLGIVVRIVKGALKIRYLLLGGAIGGGVQFNKKLEEWKEAIPSFGWLDNYLPPPEQLDKYRKSLLDMKDNLSERNSRTLNRLSDTFSGSLTSFDQWLDEAKEAVKKEQNSATFEARPNPMGNIDPSSAAPSHIKSFFNATPDSAEKTANERERLQHLQEEIMRVQRKYQKELEKLEKDNRELRQQLMQSNDRKKSNRKIKKSIIDLYSEVLDEIEGYDEGFQVQDHLPRVIVVGDQSAGKTSALEMIAQARIFPRGAGEMMTRSPVKVTLSEGPNHVAQFNDHPRVYDLKSEADLSDLRDEVERRMRSCVKDGKSISMETISLTVKGPGIQRMVLVDLPGVISTVTTEMSRDTRESIKELTKLHMSNPNAIILCIQDGSVDAERSIITDLVSEMDPLGKRTIFVLTKVDVAEQNMANPGRLKKILDGKLFPMKALGYFAVVCGKGNKNDTIEGIKSYEDNFFRQSKLIKNGVLTASQCTTHNLSLAVSECFWKMVKRSVKEQETLFKLSQFNLESEWKNSFPHGREMSRDEYFDKAKGDLLDETIKFTQLSPIVWENILLKHLWQSIDSYVFERVYLPAAQTSTTGTFNTQIDINLKHWAEGDLSSKALQTGQECLKSEYARVLKQNISRLKDKTYESLMLGVIDETLERYTWDERSSDIIKVIQMNALEDRIILDQASWNSAIKFFEKSITDILQHSDQKLSEMVGPGYYESWFTWKRISPEQYENKLIKTELKKLLDSNYYQGHLPTLSHEEILVVKKNLESNRGLTVDTDRIKKIWFLLFRSHFLKNSLIRAKSGKSSFEEYRKDPNGDSNDIVLFFRIQKMLNATSNALRQQIVNVENRRLEKLLKETLDDYSNDQRKKEELLTGRKVQLAEELKKVREIREMLEEFMNALNDEK